MIKGRFSRPQTSNAGSKKISFSTSSLLSMSANKLGYTIPFENQRKQKPVLRAKIAFLECVISKSKKHNSKYSSLSLPHKTLTENIPQKKSASYIPTRPGTTQKFKKKIFDISKRISRHLRKDESFVSNSIQGWSKRSPRDDEKHMNYITIPKTLAFTKLDDSVSSDCNETRIYPHTYNKNRRVLHLKQASLKIPESFTGSKLAGFQSVNGKIYRKVITTKTSPAKKK